MESTMAAYGPNILQARGGACPDVFLYFWDARTGLVLSSWLLRHTVRTDPTWAWSPSSAQCPPPPEAGGNSGEGRAKNTVCTHRAQSDHCQNGGASATNGRARVFFERNL